MIPTSMSDLTISITSLSKLAAEDACPRCFWLNERLKGKWPQSRFPGVFTHLDRAGKLVIDRWINEKQKTPPWLEKFGRIQRLIKPPHWSKFCFVHDGVMARGEADVLAVLESGGILVVDTKVSTFTDLQEKVLPIYAAQVNGYGLAVEAQGIGSVEKLAIVYFQPQSAGLEDDMIRDGGMAVYFSALPLGVNRHDDRIFEMCARAKQILSSPLPSGSCEECAKLDRLVSVVQQVEVPA